MSGCSRPGEDSNSPSGDVSSSPGGASSSSSGGSSPPAGGSSSSDVSGKPSCKGDFTITSKTVFASPADRSRKRIAVGEKVELEASKGTAEWKIASGGGSLSPNRGKNAKVTYTAGDSGETVVIQADQEDCSAKITLTVVEPSSWTMKRASGSNLKHKKGRPDCGWHGSMYIHPDDVNFCTIESREKDSSYVGTRAYKDYNGDKHGNYPAPDYASKWFKVTSHSASSGSHVAMVDSIYTGDPGAAVTGSKPPFTTGSGYFPITMQWRIGAGNARDFPVTRQEDEIFAVGQCESRKGSNTESTMYNDPTSSY